MSIFYLFLIILVIIFSFCALVGVIQFFIDTKRFSSYKAELDSLKSKADKLLDSREEEGESSS